jgi:hypothetical protein
MNAQHRQKLQVLQSRAKNLTLFGSAPDGQSWGDHISENIERTLKAGDAELKDNRQRMAKLIQRMHKGDQEAEAEYRGLVIERTNNYILPTMNFGRFFDVRTLGPEENPAIKNETKQEIKVKYVGKRGQNEVTDILYPNEKVPVNWHVLESEEIEFETFDLYEGDISDVARQQFNIDLDLAHQLESKLDPKTGLLSANVFGAFNLTGNKGARVYVPHSRIDPTILPKTNELVIAGVGQNTKLGQAVFEVILNYCACLTKTTPDGDLAPTGEIIVRANEMIQVISSITLTNTNQNAIAQQILQRGFYELGEILGVNWKFIPDNVIAPGRCYPVLNKPVGMLWLKPTADQAESKAIRRGRLMRMWQNKVIAAAIPTPNLKNVVRAQYHT